jgi:hypothetical protein
MLRFGADRALDHLDRGVVGAGELLHHDRHVGEITRHLELLVEAQDRLCRDRRAQSRDIASAPAAFQPIDACPFTHVVAVGRTAVEKVLLEARHEGRLRIVPFAVGIGRGKAHIESRLGKKAFLDADDHRQIEHRVVRRDFDDGLSLTGLHGFPLGSSGDCGCAQSIPG